MAQIAQPTFQNPIERPSLFRSPWVTFLLRFSRNIFAVLGVAIILGFIFIGLVGPLVAPYDYRAVVGPSESLPSLQHLLGTDRLGRDQFSRMLYAARTALVVAPLVVSVSLGLGVTLGLLSGYFGGWVDMLIMRLSDLIFAFPGLLFAILLAATLGPRIDEFFKPLVWARPFVRAGWPEFIVVVLALSTVGWAGMARLVRGQVLRLRELAYVEAARAIGASHWTILRRHILPNAIVPVIVAISMGLGGAILAESTLSFLGIGVQPPTPSWGQMIQQSMSEGYWRKAQAPTLVWAPGLAVAVLVFAFNFVGDGLNDALNPQNQQGKK
jgi:ABC-type dipeptide/oligopeptide/nickel transport system permease subunit